MMAGQSSYRGGGGGVKSVGDYMVGKQIGSGSFSMVFHARHRVHGTEVAIKEIVTGRLNKKLEESLISEIDILRNVSHPNIIRLYDMIKEPGKIHLVLEYCKGGDLSMFIQRRQGRIPESTAKHFLQQLAAGLKILRENHVIHRDLKPQNLLLSTNDDSSTLKIADFGFARSLQPRNLAETLCGSPLYMAPEIMQLQKYDAKADLWSVGAILFQLVTGRTPFTGNNQMQLLQNILKSTELHFPSDVKDLSPDCIDLCRKLLRRNPVERLTFEEFFNHPFLSQRKPEKSSRISRSSITIDGFSFSETNPMRNREEAQEDFLPFSPDDDSSGPDGSPSSSSVKRSPLRLYGFSLDTRNDRMEVSKSPNKTENTNFKLVKGTTKESVTEMDHRSVNTSSKVMDSLELIVQDYVLVSGPSGDSVTSSTSASKPLHFPAKSASPSSFINATSSSPVPILGGATGKMGFMGSLDSSSSAPSGTSQGSMDIGDSSEQPSTDCMTRIKSLHQCASVIKELVNEKIDARKQLEAFSIQLVILAIWKQALHICHTQAASAVEGSPSQETMRLQIASDANIQECLDTAKSPQEICSHIERAFLGEVGNAEDLSKVIEPGNTEMPDAMETIFQSALDYGRHGAGAVMERTKQHISKLFEKTNGNFFMGSVLYTPSIPPQVDEYMGDTENASTFYSKAVRLLVFLLVEAPSLILNPPFSLTNSDRYRLRTYIDVLNNRQSHSKSQLMALVKCEDQNCPP